MVTGQDHPIVTKLWNLDRQPNICYEIEIKKYFRMKDKSANYKIKRTEYKNNNITNNYKINLKMITIRIGQPTIKKR
jgi:hypothetical protein